MMLSGTFVFKRMKLVGHGCLQMMCSSYRPELYWASGNTKREMLSWWWKDRMENNYNVIWRWALSRRFEVFCEHRGELRWFGCEVRRKVWERPSWWGWPLSWASKRSSEDDTKHYVRQRQQCQVSNAFSLLLARNNSERKGHHIALVFIGLWLEQSRSASVSWSSRNQGVKLVFN